MATQYAFASEDAVWQCLSDILSKKIKISDIEISIENLSWASFHVKYEGKPYHQSLTTTAMKGLVEYQRLLYQSVGILTGASKVSSLTDDEKRAYELVFYIKEGSSEGDASGENTIKGIAQSALNHMTSRQTFIAACLLIVCFFGADPLKTLIGNKVELGKITAEKARDEASHQEIMAFIERDKEKDQIIKEAVAQSAKASAILDANIKAIDAVVRNASQVDRLTVGRSVISGGAVDELTRQTRRQSETSTETGTFFAYGVDKASAERFRVRLVDVATGVSFYADLDDPLAHERYYNVIQRAIFREVAIRIRLSAKKIGGNYVEAKILKASRFRER